MMNTNHAIVHQLNQVARSISKQVNRVLEPYGLYSGEWAVLVVLYEQGPMPQRELAEYLHIEAAAVSKGLRRLLTNGLVERQAGEDRRTKWVSLSEAARAQFPAWEAAIDEHRRALLTGLAAADKACLLRCLQLMHVQSEGFSSEEETHE